MLASIFRWLLDRLKAWLTSQGEQQQAAKDDAKAVDDVRAAEQAREEVDNALKQQSGSANQQQPAGSVGNGARAGTDGLRSDDGFERND